VLWCFKQFDRAAKAAHFNFKGIVSRIIAAIRSNVNAPPFASK